MKECQAQAAVCSARIRQKTEKITEHVHMVLELSAHLAVEVNRVKTALNDVAEREKDPEVLAEIFQSTDDMLLAISFTEANLKQHIGTIRLEMGTASRALATVLSMEVMVDSAIQRGAPYSAKLLASEREFSKASESELLTLDEQKVIDEIKMMQASKYLYWSEKQLARLAKIPNWRATVQILVMAKAMNKDAKREVLLRSALMNRKFVPQLEEYVTEGLNNYAGSGQAVFDTMIANDQSDEVTDYLIKYAFPRRYRHPTFMPKISERTMTNAQLPLLKSEFEESIATGNFDEQNSRRNGLLMQIGRIKTPESIAFLREVLTGDWTSRGKYPINHMNQKSKEANVREFYNAQIANRDATFRLVRSILYETQKPE